MYAKARGERWVDPFGRDLERVRRDAVEARALADLLGEIRDRVELLEFDRVVGVKFLRRRELDAAKLGELYLRDQRIAEELELYASDQRAWRDRRARHGTLLRRQRAE